METKKVREARSNIVKRISKTRYGDYEFLWVYLPKVITTDSLFEKFIEKFKGNKIPVKVRIVAESEEIKVKGPALLITLIDQ